MLHFQIEFITFLVFLFSLFSHAVYSTTNTYLDEIAQSIEHFISFDGDEGGESDEYLKDSTKDILSKEDVKENDDDEGSENVSNDVSDITYGIPYLEKKGNNDDVDGHNSDHNITVQSPIYIDEKLDGKVIDDKDTVIVQGDIAMRRGEERLIFDLGDDKNKPGDETVRDIIKDSQYYWPNAVVPYIFESSLTQAARTAVSEAILEFNTRTCVRLVPRTNQGNYVSFFKGDGCYSHVGMIKGKQQISIGSGCEYKKTAVHEIMHALGFWHEQSRTDRDDYVTINYHNIEQPAGNPNRYIHNFARKRESEVVTLNHPYDYASVMHYPKDAFGVTSGGKRAITITPKIATALGQCSTCGLSTIDASQVIALYCSKPQSTVPSYAVIAGELKMMMAAFKEQNNDVFRITLLNHLKRKYAGYYWTVSSYNGVTGSGTHYFRGYCGHVWRYYNKNVVACYSKKTARLPTQTKRNEIANAVLASVRDKGCDAKSIANEAWRVATSYGYPISVAHNVRHGSGLRTQWFAYTYFWNYRCQQTCEKGLFKNVCTDHMSSLILMFGGP